MKKIVPLIAFQLFGLAQLHAQINGSVKEEQGNTSVAGLTVTIMIEQYCQIIATPRLLSNKVTIDIDFGEEKKFWDDTRLRTYDGRLKKFNTIIDALNFMGREGWIFINAYPVRNGSTDVYHYGFRKLFPRYQVQ